MADRSSPGLSRIPVIKSPTPTREICVRQSDISVTKPFKSVITVSKENGEIKSPASPVLTNKEKSFDRYLMTGDLILKTNNSEIENSYSFPKDSNIQKIAKESHIPKLGHMNSRIGQYHSSKQNKSLNMPVLSSKTYSKLPGPIKYQQQHPISSPSSKHKMLDNDLVDVSEHDLRELFPMVHAPVAEIEELSDLSHSSCSESEMNAADIENQKEMLDEDLTPLDSLHGQSDSSTTFKDPLSSGDSGFIHDGHTFDSEVNGASSERCIYGKEMNPNSLTEKTHVRSKSSSGEHENTSSIIASSSGEKFLLEDSERPLVRTSKSHENYLQAVTGISVVNIDIDTEDNLAYSLDNVTYQANSDTSLEHAPQDSMQAPRSLHNSPERKINSMVNGDREYKPVFISIEDTKSVKLKNNISRGDRRDNYNENSSESSIISEHTVSGDSPMSAKRQHFLSEKLDGSPENSPPGTPSNICEHDSLHNASMLSDDSDAESLYHQPSKAVDRPSAVRLAKRLFNLEGFRKSDVSRHLYKKNDFSNLVAEEYLKYFNFEEDTLDSALRKFLSQFSLYGETQERERVLAHFSQRFMECNPDSFNSEDACHTLTCAIMLLHSDLHSKNVRRRMTCQEFIENLSGLNDGENFPKEVLKAIYQAIKTGSIEWAVDEDLSEIENGNQDLSLPPQSPILGTNPFLEVPDAHKATEYKKGYVMRKCCFDPEKRKTPFGKRGWKMLYAVLKDMILYQYKDEHHFGKGNYVQSAHNAIRIHHALATKATDYTKKQHVFRLQTSDWAEYLFQTGNPKELQEWVDTINLVAATLSAPPLPGAVGSKSKFQRPLLPSSFTKCNIKEQLKNHELKVEELQQEYNLHRSPEKGAKSSVIQEYTEKDAYLEYEIKRFKTYAYLLEGKISNMIELEPSLTETTIGEYEEVGATPSDQLNLNSELSECKSPHKLSDRYSYRAAIFQNETVEDDLAENDS